jgi:DNA-directed RNA polymerase subunit beta
MPTVPSWAATCSARPCPCCGPTPGGGHGHGEEGRDRLGRRGGGRGRRRGGRAATADAIVIRYDNPDMVAADSFFDQGGLKEYRLRKFKRSNQDTCYNQKPLVQPGEKVKKGEPIADGPCTQQASWLWAATCCGLHALGRLQLRGCHPGSARSWSRTTPTPRCTSRSSSLQVRDTKRGVEEVTREIPNVGEEALVNLDEDGIIYPGAGCGPATSWSARSRPRARPS